MSLTLDRCGQSFPASSIEHGGPWLIQIDTLRMQYPAHYIDISSLRGWSGMFRRRTNRVFIRQSIWQENFEQIGLAFPYQNYDYLDESLGGR